MLERFIGLPLRVTNTLPVRISFSRQYTKRRVQSVLGSNTLRIFPLQCTCASCRFNAENVIYSSSMTRIPVEQIVCRISARRIFPLRCAALTKQRYSSRVSSFSRSQNVRRCCLSNRTLQSAAPIYDRKLFTATNIELMLVAAYPFPIKYCLLLKIGVKPARAHGRAPRAHSDLRPYHRFTTFGESPDMPEPIRDRMGSFFCRTRPLPATPLLSDGMFGTGARARVRVHPEARLAAMENPGGRVPSQTIPFEGFPQPRDRFAP